MGFRKQFKGVRLYVGKRRSSVSFGGLTVGAGNRRRESRNNGAMSWMISQATPAAGIGCVKAIGILYALAATFALPAWLWKKDPVTGAVAGVGATAAWLGVFLLVSLRRQKREVAEERLRQEHWDSLCQQYGPEQARRIWMGDPSARP